MRIVYSRPDGGVSVLIPAEGARLASAVIIDGKRHILDAAKPVDTVFRRWPVEGVIAEWAETESEFLARIAIKDVPADATNAQIVDVSAIPVDRSFRNAWEIVAGGRIEHDMGKCREIHKDRLRAIRAPKLVALDIEYQRADEDGDVQRKQAVAAKKRALRDVTVDPRIQAAQTPEELKAVIPEALL